MIKYNSEKYEQIKKRNKVKYTKDQEHNFYEILYLGWVKQNTPIYKKVWKVFDN